MAGEQPCSAGEDVTNQEIGKEWIDDNIVEPQMPYVVEEPIKDEQFTYSREIKGH